MKEDTYRIGASQIYPYRYYYAAFSPLPRIEIQGQVTEIMGVKALQSGYGNAKDKAVSVKYQFLPETKYLPALAVDIIDPTGTRVYASQSLIASKQLYPFDFTVGLGNGRFGKQQLPAQDEGFKVEMFSDPAQWARDSQVFWGIQFSPSPKYSLMVEYNPINYEKQTRDPAQPKYFENGKHFRSLL
ncbi:MAG: YjbH domain-containing protein [Syntrophales bacterium LBB04]|nr:YjbH domain-containing protein [Syntrophales bacterium LBB04]